jgi:hypothetical protein
MRLLPTPAKLLLARSIGVVALCYALLVQAALAPVGGAKADMSAAGALPYALCLTDHAGADGRSGSSGPDHHDMGCCIPVSRLELAGPALLPVSALQLPAPSSRLFQVVASPAAPHAPPSIDLENRAARAPPSLLA